MKYIIDVPEVKSCRGCFRMYITPEFAICKYAGHDISIAIRKNIISDKCPMIKLEEETK